jgi:hypothetical protein
MCELCNISKPFHLHGMCFSHKYLWTNHLCISFNHILVHLRLSLNYQNQKKTFQEVHMLIQAWLNGEDSLQVSMQEYEREIW